MVFLFLPGAVIGFVFGAAVGWGISMLIWGEPHVPMITTLVVTCSVVGALVFELLTIRKKK